jgi:hypothetical protein
VSGKALAAGLCGRLFPGLCIFAAELGFSLFTPTYKKYYDVTARTKDRFPGSHSMNGFALLLATALLGVDYGWQPASDGRLEYIVQIEPVTLIALREGQEVVSQIDPLARGVRRFRIRVGTEVVPRLGTPPQQPVTPSSTASAPPPGVTYGWQPHGEQQLEFLIQIAPERLAILAKEPVTGELPPELGSVSRIRIRAGTANLPRQDLPRKSETTAGDPSRPAQTAAPGVGESPVPAGGPTDRLPSGNERTASGVNSNATSPGSSWPPDDRGNVPKQPSRYDLPAGSAAAAATDPRAVQPSQQPQGDSWQASANQNSSWPVGQRPLPGNAAAQPADPSGPQNGPQAGLAAPGVQPAWGSGPAASSNAAAGEQPASLSPPWGTPDNRFTTDRGRAGGNPPAVAPSGAATTPWGPLVALPASQTPSPESPAYATAPASSWSPPAAAASPQGGMVSPFFQNSPTTGNASDSLTALTQPPWQTGSAALTETSLATAASEPKASDFWADLAEAADDPDAEFLRQSSRTEASDKPWWPLTLAMLALFASMGGNLYLGWIAVDVYRRYLELTVDDDYDESYDSRRERDERREWDDRPRRRERVALED